MHSNLRLTFHCGCAEGQAELVNQLLRPLRDEIPRESAGDAGMQSVHEQRVVNHDPWCS